jgi:hypothetical protein
MRPVNTQIHSFKSSQHFDMSMDTFLYIQPWRCYIQLELGVNPFSAPVPAPTHLSSIEELLDEGERLLAVLVDVLLVRVGVVAGAAVGVGRVAVRLDDGRAGGRALEPTRAGGELEQS